MAAAAEAAAATEEDWAAEVEPEAADWAAARTVVAAPVEDRRGSVEGGGGLDGGRRGEGGHGGDGGTIGGKR